MKKLNVSQIEQLFVFTKKHYVEYYDLQTELVDHLAHAIEVEWQQNENNSFEELLQKEFKKFGIFGFSDIVEQRHKALTTKYYQIIKKHIIDFFNIPKIITTMSLFFFLLLLIKYIKLNYLTSILFSLPIIFSFIFIYYYHLERIKNYKKSNKKWLFEEIIFNFGAFLSIFQIPFQTGIFISKGDISMIGIWVITLILTVLYLLTYIVFYEIPQKANQYLIKNYPEYNMM
jgi:hypothetical protein